MSTKPKTNSQVFDLLEGIWAGEGRGQFPTVTSFDYRETLIFTRRDEKTLAYEQRAQKLYDGQAGLKPPAQHLEALRADCASRFQPTSTN